MSLAVLLATAHAAVPRHHRVAVLDEAIALPGTHVLAPPVHPGLLAGLSLWSSGGARLEHRLQLDVSTYRHRPVEHVLSALPCWQGTGWLAPPLGLSVLGGVGYRHALPTGPAYARDAAGRPRRARWGRPGLTAALGLGLDLRLGERWAVLLQHRASLDGPSSPELAPVIPHASTLLGLEHRR